MNKDKEKVLATFHAPKLFSRVAAFSLDAAIFVGVSLLLSSVASYVLSMPGNSVYIDNALQSEHIDSSHLSYYDNERGYLTYETSELLTYQDDKLVYSDILSYYYCHYLTGKDVADSEVASLNKDNNKDIYSVSWFNENILRIGAADSFFEYDKSGGDINLSIPGVLKENYYSEVEENGILVKKVNDNEALKSEVKSTYDEAVKHFFAQDFIKKASNELSLINSILLFASTSISLAIFYIAIPMSSKYGMTLGKRLMGLIILNDNGFLLKRYKMLLRAIPLLAVLAIISFIPVLRYQIISALIVSFVSLTLGLFTPYKQALHDFTAGTVVVSKEDAIICSSMDDWNKVFIKTEEKKDGK